MNYSFWHKDFAIHLEIRHNINKYDVLDNPKNYLGPNYKEVLNCWFYWDSLSIEQKGVYWDRRWQLDNETYDKALKTSIKLASEVIDPRFVWHLRSWEREIIASNLYIERGISFTYLPIFLDEK